MVEDRLVGTQLGDYVLEERVGEGAFLDVYRGTHTSLKRDVAIKVLNKLDEQKRLKREIDVLAQVGNHPNIVNIFDADPTAQTPYAVVEFCSNGTLANRLKNGAFGWRDAATITTQLLKGLEYAHGKGILHGDIKPSNVLFDYLDNAKLSDFNAAEMNGNGEAREASLAQSLSLVREGVSARGFEGTVLYWAPEERRGNDVDERTDIYHVGEILYEMKTGQRFLDRDGGVVPTSEAAWLDEIIAKATKANPAERYQSAGAMRQQLLLGLEGKLDKDEPFVSEDLRKVGRKIWGATKWLGKAITAPAWGPVWAFNKALDRRDDSEPIVAIAGMLYYGLAIGGSVEYIEGRAEAVTRKAVEPIVRAVPADEFLGYIADDKLHLTPINTLLDNNRITTEFVLPNYGGLSETNGAVGEVDGVFFYTGAEKHWSGGEEEEVPQIFGLNLHDGKLIRMIDYSRYEIAQKLQDKEFDEVRPNRDENGMYALVKMDNSWYRADQQNFEQLNRVSLPLESKQALRLGTSDYIFDVDDRIQLSRKGQFWGDLELFKGQHPMLITLPAEK